MYNLQLCKIKMKVVPRGPLRHHDLLECMYHTQVFVRGIPQFMIRIIKAMIIGVNASKYAANVEFRHPELSHRGR